MSTQIDKAKENNNIEQISAKLFAGLFNGIPVVNDKDHVIGIVTAIDILRSIRDGKTQYYDSKRHNDTQSLCGKKRYANK